MTRPAGVTVIAILSLIGSLICVLLTVVLFLSIAFVPMNEAAAVGSSKLAMIPGLVFLLIAAAWGISTSIGLLRLKRWARISTIVFSSLLSFMGVITPVFVLAIPMPPTPGADPATMSGVKIGITVFYLMLAAIGIWWIIYLTRPHVKAPFESGLVTSQTPSRRPPSITAIGWLLLIGACFTPLNMALGFPAMVLSFVVGGVYARLIYLAFGVVSLVAGYGLLQLKEYGRITAMVYFAFGLVNGLTFLLPASRNNFARILESAPNWMRTTNPPPFNPGLTLVFTVPLMLLPFYFLIKHREAFHTPA